MHSSFLRSAAVAAVAAAICAPTVAHAETRSFNVAAQPASNGIREFAKQAGIQITISGPATRGRTTNAVQGSLDTRAALDQLLSGTGLSVQSFDGKVAILAAQSNADASNEITLTGTRTGPDSFNYFAEASTTNGLSELLGRSFRVGFKASF